MHIHIKFKYGRLLSFYFGEKQIEKIPIDDIKKELKLIGMSEVAVEELLQVLSIKSLEKLEGAVP